MGIQRSLSMLGSAVSSSTPNDCQPNSHIGVLGSRPLMNRHAWKAPSGLAYAAVGMQRALDSAIGLPRRSTSALWILVFLMPAEVRRYFIMPLFVDVMRAERLLQSLALRLKQNDRVSYTHYRRRGSSLGRNAACVPGQRRNSLYYAASPDGHGSYQFPLVGTTKGAG